MTSESKFSSLWMTSFGVTINEKGWRMVKSETRREAEILVRNPSPRLFGEKVSRLKKSKSKPWKNETSRLIKNASEISRSCPNFPRPTFFEVPFATPNEKLFRGAFTRYYVISFSVFYKFSWNLIFRKHFLMSMVYPSSPLLSPARSVFRKEKKPHYIGNLLI